jgi:hypothetical protein
MPSAHAGKTPLTSSREGRNSVVGDFTGDSRAGVFEFHSNFTAERSPPSSFRRRPESILSSQLSENYHGQIEVIQVTEPNAFADTTDADYLRTPITS